MRMYVRVYVCMRVYERVYARVCTYACLYERVVCVCVYERVWVCAYGACMRVLCLYARLYIRERSCVPGMCV